MVTADPIYARLNAMSVAEHATIARRGTTREWVRAANDAVHSGYFHNGRTRSNDCPRCAYEFAFVASAVLRREAAAQERAQ